MKISSKSKCEALLKDLPASQTIASYYTVGCESTKPDNLSEGRQIQATGKHKVNDE